MLPPGHYSTMAQMRPQMGQQGPAPPYGYSQSMPAAVSAQSATPSQPSYNVPQSSPHYQLASSHPPQNGSGGGGGPSSLEALDKVLYNCNCHTAGLPNAEGYLLHF